MRAAGGRGGVGVMTFLHPRGITVVQFLPQTQSLILLLPVKDHSVHPKLGLNAGSKGSVSSGAD